MRYHRQIDYSDWEESEQGSSQYKRKRQIRSSAYESKRCRYDDDNIQTYNTLYSDNSCFHERDHHERRYVEEYRNNHSQLFETRHHYKNYESGHHNHSSKSSGHSSRSSYKKKISSHHGKSHHSHTRSHRKKRSRSVEDDEEGHLICQSGDILNARCIEYFSKLIHF